MAGPSNAFIHRRKQTHHCSYTQSALLTQAPNSGTIHGERLPQCSKARHGRRHATGSDRDTHTLRRFTSSALLSERLSSLSPEDVPFAFGGIVVGDRCVLRVPKGRSAAQGRSQKGKKGNAKLGLRGVEAPEIHGPPAYVRDINLAHAACGIRTEARLCFCRIKYQRHATSRVWGARLVGTKVGEDSRVILPVPIPSRPARSAAAPRRGA